MANAPAAIRGGRAGILLGRVGEEKERPNTGPVGPVLSGTMPHAVCPEPVCGAVYAGVRERQILHFVTEASTCAPLQSAQWSGYLGQVELRRWSSVVMLRP